MSTLLEDIINASNEEPVAYCKHCLSLAIRVSDGEADYCVECGNTDIIEGSIKDWEELYKLKYGKPYIK